MSQVEAIRKAFIEQIEALSAAGVTHLPKLDLSGLATPVEPVRAVSPTNGGLAPRQSRESVFASRRDSAGPSARASIPKADLNGDVSATTLLGNEFGSGGLYGSPTPATERAAALEVISNQVSQCTKCSELARLRKNTVPGVGNPNTRLCFVGEAPGAEEDLRGEPFVGAAGQLLDKIIEAIKLKREDVFILNTIKCRPPGNRVPNDGELVNCWHFAERQLEIIQPEFICCLGSVAAKTLLKTNNSIGQLRGKIHSYRGSRVIVTYHPAYLLRTPSAKRLVWDDMKILMGEMGLG